MMLTKIFFPQCCVRAPSGILLGRRDISSATVHIVAVVHFPITPKLLAEYLSRYRSSQIDLRPLGTWLPLGENDGQSLFDFQKVVPKLFGREQWITLVTRKDAQSGSVDFFVEDFGSVTGVRLGLLSEGDLEKISSASMVIIYNQKEIWESESLHITTADTNVSTGAVEQLVAVISDCKGGLLSYESGLNSDEDKIKITHCCIERELSLIFFIFSIFASFSLEFIHIVIFYIHKFYTSYKSVLSLILKALYTLLQISSLCTHTVKRFSDFGNSMLNTHRKFDCSKDNTESNCKDRNVIASFFMDILLGVAMVFLLNYNGLLMIRPTREVFLPSVEFIAGQVEELIKWLMGIPAGLKLNHPLNQFLGHFFLYHVRLWLEYVRLMMDLFPHLIKYCLMSSCLGLSFFLSVLSDTVSMLSFHVYCFYVYAGRLYGLQIKGLTSLWRLFRGKKWNPLRQRVDSLEESGQGADQFFVGTLLFTVLLFLLPTTALYYAIFMLFRVAILALQVLLSSLAFVISEFPWYSTASRLFHPHKYVDSMRCGWVGASGFESVSMSRLAEDQAITLHMSTHSESYGSVILEAMKARVLVSPLPAVPELLMRKIISGELIRWS